MVNRARNVRFDTTYLIFSYIKRLYSRCNDQLLFSRSVALGKTAHAG